MQLAHTGRSSPHLIRRLRHAGRLLDASSYRRKRHLLKQPVLVRLRARELACAREPSTSRDCALDELSAGTLPSSASSFFGEGVCGIVLA